jgi:glutaredoxin
MDVKGLYDYKESGGTMNNTKTRFILMFVVCISALLFLRGMAACGQGEAGAVLPAERQNSDIKAVMYMTSWCPYCTKARKYLLGLRVDLTEYDIEKDDAKRAEMKRLSGGSTMVPLIDIEGIVIRGYVPDEMKDAVEKRKKRLM